jgi:hypothetical protein
MQIQRPIVFAALCLLFAGPVRGALISLDAIGDTQVQDGDLDGIFDSMFGYGGGATSFGAITQKSRPSNPGWVEVRDAIRFDLAPLAAMTVTSATLRLIQYGDFRGLQVGSESVYGFIDDVTPELDDATQGALVGAGEITAPGIQGAVVELDVTQFLAAAALSYTPGDFAVFRLENPVTAELNGNPYSLSFYDDRTTGGDPLRLIVEAVPEPGSAVQALLAAGAIAGLRPLRRRRCWTGLR